MDRKFRWNPIKRQLVMTEGDRRHALNAPWRATLETGMLSRGTVAVAWLMLANAANSKTADRWAMGLACAVLVDRSVDVEWEMTALQVRNLAVWLETGERALASGECMGTDAPRH